MIGANIDAEINCFLKTRRGCFIHHQLRGMGHSWQAPCDVTPHLRRIVVRRMFRAPWRVWWARLFVNWWPGAALCVFWWLLWLVSKFLVWRWTVSIWRVGSEVACWASSMSATDSTKLHYKRILFRMESGSHFEKTPLKCSRCRFDYISRPLSREFRKIGSASLWMASSTPNFHLNLNNDVVSFVHLEKIIHRFFPRR